MRILNRIICLILATSLLIGFSPAKASSNINNEEYFNHAFEVLSKLGIVNESSASEISDDEKISRGDFLRVVLRLTNLSIPSDNDKQFFSDVNKLNKYYYDVSLGCSLGIISGEVDGKFLPNDKIEFSAAVKILMSLLGWDEVCRESGGYPLGYIQKANEAGLFNGISTTDAKITKKLAYELIYNALDATMLVVDSYSQEGSQKTAHYAKSSVKVLEYYKGIKKIEGKFMANYEMNLIRSKIIKNNEIIIDNSIFYTDANTDAFVGKICECYYDANDNVVALAESYETNKSIVIYSDDIIDFKDNEYTYYKDGSKSNRNARVSTQADICYNGRILSPYYTSYMFPSNGSVTLIDNNSDGLYDSVIIYNYRDLCVKGTNSDTETIFDMYSTNNVCLKDYGTYVFRDDLGNELTTSSLLKYDVISVAESSDKEYAKIISSCKEISGKVQSIVIGDYKAVIVNDSEFEFADCIAPVVDTISSGEECLFILNMTGKIASVQKVENAFSYAYLMGVIKDTSIDAKAKIKFFGEDGKIYQYKLDYNILFDGKTIKPKDIYAKLKGKFASNRGVFRYRRKDDKLIEIDTDIDNYYNGYDDAGNKIQSLRWRPNASVFGGKVVVNSKTIVFSVPAPDISAEDGMYTVGKTNSMFISDNSYAFNAYKKDKDRHFANVLVVYSKDAENTITSTTAAAVVSEITSAIDDQGCDGYKIKAYSSSSLSEYFVADKTLIDQMPSLSGSGYHKLECGDIIRVSRGFYNRVTQIELIYERASGLTKSDTSLGDGGGSVAFRAVKAKVYSRDEQNLYITQTELKGTTMTVPLSDIETFSVDTFYGAWKCVYENKKYVLKKAVASDAFDYKSVGDNCSDVVVTTNWGDPRLIVIY